MAAKWKTPLTAPITLRGGTTLRTLAEAKACLRTDCAGLKHDALDYANEVLDRAAKSGTEDDLKEATASVHRILRWNRVA